MLPAEAECESEEDPSEDDEKGSCSRQKGTKKK